MKSRTFIPSPVMGGFRIARTSWVLVDAGTPAEGWDELTGFDGMDETVWPTREACEAAITEQHGDQT